MSQERGSAGGEPTQRHFRTIIRRSTFNKSFVYKYVCVCVFTGNGAKVATRLSVNYMQMLGAAPVTRVVAHSARNVAARKYS